MTIDPTLYRKVSGKGGDAEKKLGDSLARLGHRPRRVQQESGPPEWVSAIGTMVMSR